MKVSLVVEQYVNFKQSLGMCFLSQLRILRSFCRMVGDKDINEIEADSVSAFISGKGPVTSFWHQKFTIIKGFYRFAIARRYVDISPLPKIIPKRPEPSPPYIYTTEELRRLLKATDTLETPLSILQAITFRTLLLVLYGTGMRISEALSLALKDVDLLDCLITVRESKFFKSRLVPIGSTLTKTLKAYVDKRTQLPCPAGDQSALFVSRTGNTIGYDRVNDIWQILRKRADIYRKDKARYQPRIHDLRATFAVHRLISWYREGADVQRMLPLLSTYLGHQNIIGTQRYLPMIPELLDEARHRFEQYALPEVNHE
jgi:site-specific recombinase XerD